MHVSGEGPIAAPILFVGEGPGWQEDRCGRPFQGKAGAELDRNLEAIGLPRRSVRLTNLYREYGGQDYVWAAEDLARDEPELLAELRQMKGTLKTIVPLGRYATRWFLGDVDMGSVQGLPWRLPPSEKLSFLAQSTVVNPIIHPSAGLRNPEMSPYVVSGFHELGRYLKGEMTPRTLFDDAYPEVQYVEIRGADQLDATFRSRAPGCALSIDTEGWPGCPWSVQYAFEPGTAYLIAARAPDLLQRFGRHCRRVRARLVYHSALHDLGMQQVLDLGLAGLKFDDTMVMAYLLQIEEQGLKPLCVRHCGMQMQSYDEILGDAGNRLALDYLTWIYDGERVLYDEACLAEFERRRTETWTDKRGKTHVGRRITKVPSLPKSPLLKAAQRCLGSKTPRKLWLDQVEDVQVAGYTALGPIPEATLDLVPRPTAVHYGCRDADGTVRVRDVLSGRIDAMGLRDVYNLELSTYPLIDRMHRIGLKPDLAHFAALSAKLQGEIDTLRIQLCRDTQRDDFNANSGDQVAEYLFGTLGLDSIKDTRSGRGSTNDKILEALEREHPEHPSIATVRQYRETYKLKNTFVDRLPDFVQRWPFDGRIHATFRTTRVVTGRLAASEPNILAQPEHGKFAGDFKRGWVADDGHVIGAWDESQVELRGLAHLSQDPVLLAVYRGELRNPDGSLVDLHAKLAQRIFGGPIQQYMSKCAGRLAAKAINFGIPMGMTCRGLSVELRKNGVEADEDTAQRWLDETLDLYTGVRIYMDGRIAEAKQNGFIRCLSGRIRYIGGIRSRDDRVREEAERFAFSTPIQESATFIMKQAEATVWEALQELWKQGLWIEPLVQIHDCLKLEFEDGIQDAVNAIMQEAMTQVPKGFSVPLAVDGEWGLNMKDMVPFS